MWCWRRLLRVPWTVRRSNQSILKEISPGCSLEGVMLKLKLQYFGHLMQRADSLEKTLMLGKIESRRGRGQQRWGGWMASPTRWTWVWVDSGSWWWTGRPGVLWWDYHTIALARLCSKSFKLGFSSTWTENFQRYKLGFEKAEGPEIKLPTFARSWRKQRSSRKTSTSAHWVCKRLWLCGSQQTIKFLKRREY